MPDTLTHYAISYLVTSRVAKPKHALLLALIGLLPDIDAILRIHRWATHSLVITATLIATAAIPVLYTNQKYLRYLAIVSTLYTLHIILDIFTAPTPLLWPLTSQAYMLSIELNSVVIEDGVRIASAISISSKATDFTQKLLIEAPIISAQGMIIAIGVATILLVEWLAKRWRYKHG